MYKKSYLFKKINSDLLNIPDDNLWERIESTKIKDYLWVKNGYQPEVIIKGCYSDKFIYLNFNVFEKKVTIRYSKVDDPVFKDSCVEFFLNLFPDEVEEYFNIEFNAIGTIKMGFGIFKNRIYLNETDLRDINVITSIKEKIEGYHGSESWKLYYAIPIKLLEKFYLKKFTGNDAYGNFFKCGDETEFKHYGVWNYVDSPIPDFHLPQYFGKIHFQ